MKMRCPALPIAVAVAACLWASGAMAQAGTMPGDGQESRPAVPAGSSAHRTWELPGSAQPAHAPAPDSAAGLRRRALAAMEVLREEIATLGALKHAQEALLAWNGAGAEVGNAPATLTAALCAEPALAGWCPLLPATFGTPAMEDGHDRD